VVASRDGGPGLLSNMDKAVAILGTYNLGHILDEKVHGKEHLAGIDPVDSQAPRSKLTD
jgi:hypothetical protein